MRTPSIAPGGDDQDVYLVLDDFGILGRSWRETDEGSTDFETLLADLLSGQYDNPARIVCFNTATGHALDVTETIAREVRRHCDIHGRQLPASLQDFVERAS